MKNPPLSAIRHFVKILRSIVCYFCCGYPSFSVLNSDVVIRYCVKILSHRIWRGTPRCRTVPDGAVRCRTAVRRRIWRESGNARRRTVPRVRAMPCRIRFERTFDSADLLSHWIVELYRGRIPRHILADILARMSVSMLVSWNADLNVHRVEEPFGHITAARLCLATINVWIERCTLCPQKRGR